MPRYETKEVTPVPYIEVIKPQYTTFEDLGIGDIREQDLGLSHMGMLKGVVKQGEDTIYYAAVNQPFKGLFLDILLRAITPDPSTPPHLPGTIADMAMIQPLEKGDPNYSQNRFLRFIHEHAPYIGGYFTEFEEPSVDWLQALEDTRYDTALEELWRVQVVDAELEMQKSKDTVFASPHAWEGLLHAFAFTEGVYLTDPLKRRDIERRFALFIEGYKMGVYEATKSLSPHEANQILYDFLTHDPITDPLSDWKKECFLAFLANADQGQEFVTKEVREDIWMSYLAREKSKPILVDTQKGKYWTPKETTTRNSLYWYERFVENYSFANGELLMHSDRDENNEEFVAHVRQKGEEEGPFNWQVTEYDLPDSYHTHALYPAIAYRVKILQRGEKTIQEREYLTVKEVKSLMQFVGISYPSTLDAHLGRMLLTYFALDKTQTAKHMRLFPLRRSKGFMVLERIDKHFASLLGTSLDRMFLRSRRLQEQQEPQMTVYHSLLQKATFNPPNKHGVIAKFERI